MGSLAIAVLKNTHIINMKYCIALFVLGFAAYAQAGRWVYVEDDYDQHMRVRRSPQEAVPQRRVGPPPPVPVLGGYAEDLPVAASNAYGGHPKGRVGPVYTFVKTTLRPTSNGECVMLLESNTENRPQIRTLWPRIKNYDSYR